LKPPESKADINPASATKAARRAPDAIRARPAGLVRAVERGVDVDGSDGAVTALDLDDRLPIGGQGRHRGRRLGEGSLGFGIGAEDVAIAKQDDPRLGRGLYDDRPADVLLGEVF